LVKGEYCDAEGVELLHDRVIRWLTEGNLFGIPRIGLAGMADNGPEWTTMVSIVVHPDPFCKHGYLKRVVAEGYFEHVLIGRSHRLRADGS
jgi:hypothetical protein